MRETETLQEYFLHMKELANRGCIEEAALIEYVVDGIYDANNKMILYSGKDLQDFKAKLRIYSDVKGKKEFSTKEATFSKYIGHKSANCPSKVKGTKCFKCNEYGHRFFECSNKKGSENENQQSSHRVNQIESLPYTKDLIIEKKRTTALIDTGSGNNIMQGNVGKNINKSQFDQPMPYTKDLIIAEKRITALIGTGSGINNIQENVCKNINEGQFDQPSIVLNGFGNGQVKMLGSINYKLIIDNEEFRTELPVVPNEVMEVDVIIGREFLSEVKVLIEGTTTSISKREQIPLAEVITSASGICSRQHYDKYAHQTKFR
ncbi:hypothetical protein QE152_g8870 [Popillia japonica]|uniref:CCHC-type domain-containing protein n=1 Tax=Popillia japonica TaxID=7064 RepID=A0AAW1M464_POPJA